MIIKVGESGCPLRVLDVQLYSLKSPNLEALINNLLKNKRVCVLLSLKDLTSKNINNALHQVPFLILKDARSNIQKHQQHKQDSQAPTNCYIYSTNRVAVQPLPASLSLLQPTYDKRDVELCRGQGRGILAVKGRWCHWWHWWD